MTIILFLVDTSASMNQRSYLGTTFMDIAKGAVELFMKMRSRDPNSRWDRYMLLTYEDPPANVKAGWKESHATFMRELKNLQAFGLTSLGPALKYTFDLLNVNRMTSGIDTYGQGRCPFYLEPAIIICLSDGRRLTTTGSVQSELNLPMNNAVPGSELTKEPFRWDQRLFGVVFRIPATPPIETQSNFIPSADDSAIDAMCEVTGGRSYAVYSQRMLMQTLESLVQKCQSGVVINFEKFGVDPPPLPEENDKNGEEKKRSHTPPSSIAWQNCRKLIYVPRSAQKGFAVGHWPIPEAFWPDLNSPSLAPRSAHPVVRFSCVPCEPLVLGNLPFDKYELEPSPLTQYILERRQPNVAWQCFVSNSAKYSDIGHPFGYLKASTNLNGVNLFVMPYNYPVLLPLLDELAKVQKMKVTQKWRQQFDNYLKTMPVYYAVPLRRALARGGYTVMVPEQMDSCLSYSVVSYLKKLKNQAKMEYDRLVASVGQRFPVTEGIKVTSRSTTSILQRKDFQQLLQHYGGDMSCLKQELTDYNTFTLALPEKHVTPHLYRNPFDIPRKSLLDQISRMRANFLHSAPGSNRLQDEEELHSIPVQDMGNYQEYVKKLPQPLREIEVQPVRQHTFGNPFKVNKNIMIDEADEVMPGQQASRKRAAAAAAVVEMMAMSPRPNKRKPGPLPKDIPARKLMSPTPEFQPPESDTSEDEDTLPHTTGPPVSIELRLPDSDEESDEEGALVINHNDVAHEEPALTNHIEDDNRNHMKLTNHNGGENYVMSVAKLNNIRENNSKLRLQALKEVKRPGKNYKTLFLHLNLIQGSVDTQCLFVQDVIKEALRFKKRTLAEQLEQFEQSLLLKPEPNKRRASPLNNSRKSPTR